MSNFRNFIDGALDEHGIAVLNSVVVDHYGACEAADAELELELFGDSYPGAPCFVPDLVSLVYAERIKAAFPRFYWNLAASIDGRFPVGREMFQARDLSV